jgi:transposase
LFADIQKGDKEIATLLGVSRPTVYHMRKQYQERTAKHILALLQEKPHSGQPIKVNTWVESHITMITCSAPPEGAARWTLQMIEDKLDSPLAALAQAAQQGLWRASQLAEPQSSGHAWATT